MIGMGEMGVLDAGPSLPPPPSRHPQSRLEEFNSRLRVWTFGIKVPAVQALPCVHVVRPSPPARRPGQRIEVVVHNEEGG